MNAWPPPRASRRDPLASPEPRGFPWTAYLLIPTVAFWLVATAAADVTSLAVAQPAIARLLDGLTGVSGLLDVEASHIHEVATNAAPHTLIEVPGFPVRGAGIPREDVLGGTPGQWRATLLDGAAALVYRDGTQPFAQDGSAGRGGPWALRLLGERLHRWLDILRWFPGLATLGLTVALTTTLPPIRRWRVLGLAIAFGAALSLAGALFVVALASLLGGPSGTLSGEAASVVATLARGPIVEAGVVVLGGLALWWWARRPRSDDDPEARLAIARAEREARRRAAAGLPPEPRRSVR